MADKLRPTAEDVREYLGAAAGGPIAMTVMENALLAARENVLDRCMTFIAPNDEDFPTYPDRVVQAITMLAARLYRRRFSTSGYEGFGDVGVARVTTLDADIEGLISHYLRYDFA